MLDGYEYHVFVSYNRSGDVGEWVLNHFHPLLLRRLETVLADEPAVFIDKDIDVGSAWPQKLADALHHSCCMVAIWTPSYFRSGWCVAEWETIRERERLAGLRSRGNSGGLVYPVVYSDGTSFPPEAQQIQSRVDLRDYAYPFEQFRKSEKYMGFFDKVDEVATQLAATLSRSPQWDASWPTLNPPPPALKKPSFARL
jgi:hypothetical protein